MSPSSFRRQVLTGIVALMLSPLTAVATQPCPQTPADYESGARIYIERCAQCHGNDGRGEGVIPLLIGNYLNTNLVMSKEAPKRDKLRQQIELGGILPEINLLMPPWRDELSYKEIDDVTDFVMLLNTDNDKARKLMREASSSLPPSIKVGRSTYVSRCVLCHGRKGEGDGKLASFIKRPPPFNLTYSRLPDELLRQIISKGGAGVGRSPQMPPWGDELTPYEINSLIGFLKTLRQ